MNPPITNLSDDDLAQRLAALTTPVHAPTGLWQRALPAKPTRGLRLIFSRKLPAPWLAAAASLFLVFILAAALLPSLGKARSVSSARLRVSPSTYSAVEGADQLKSGAAERLSYGYKFEPPAPGNPAPADSWRAEGLGRNIQGKWKEQPARSAEPTPDLPRQVIRKATIELTTPDVRAALLKASMILNLATGEFTENSSLTGEGPTAHATLTLRVAAPRLSEVLNQLRALGKVTSEQTTGDDVTDQVVDTDARLRNEQRIESELLDLLSSRKDAPLDDILAVRTQLANIRESIERLTAQRDRLSHLVSLATILVVITTDSAPPPEPARIGIWDYFKASLADSWHSGLGALADTIAAVVRIAIGGLIWWLLLLTLFLTALHLYRRTGRAAAREPAPTE